SKRVKGVPIVGERCEESPPRLKAFRPAANRVVGRVDEGVVIGHQRCQTVQVTVVDVLVELDSECAGVHRCVSSMTTRLSKLSELSIPTRVESDIFTDGRERHVGICSQKTPS